MRPSMQCADAREKFRESKGLDQVIVGAGVEAAHAVIHGAPRSEDQDWGSETAPAHFKKSLKTSLPRQHDIQENQVESRVAQLPDSRLSGICERHLVSVSFQSFGDCTGQLTLVFYDQDSQDVLGFSARCTHS
jgi:hypothetical protein